MSEKRPCYKLYFGPDYTGWFPSQEEAKAAVSRLWKQLEDDGVVRFVEQIDPISGKPHKVLAEKPQYDMTLEMVEMTEAEYMSIPAGINWVYNRS